MTAVFNIQNRRIIHFGTNIIIIYRNNRKRKQTVNLRNNTCIELNRFNIFCNTLNQCGIQLLFYFEYTRFRTENFFLVFFKFLSYIAFRTDQRLLANPIFRNFFFMCIAYFNVVPKNIIERNFNFRYSSPFFLTFLHFQQIFLAVVRQFT